MIQRAIHLNRLALAWCRVLAGIIFGIAVTSDAPHAAESSFKLSVRGDRLTVQLHRALLGQVLSELARQACIRVELPPSMRADPISDAFADMPLEQGISRLLQGRSVAILHGTPSTQPERSGIAVTQVWVLPRQEQAQQVATEADAEEAWSRPAFLDNADPATRLAALDTFADRHDETVIDAFAQAMVDEDEMVREKAQALFDQALLQSGRSFRATPRTRK